MPSKSPPASQASLSSFRPHLCGSGRHLSLQVPQEPQALPIPVTTASPHLESAHIVHHPSVTQGRVLAVDLDFLTGSPATQARGAYFTGRGLSSSCRLNDHTLRVGPHHFPLNECSVLASAPSPFQPELQRPFQNISLVLWPSYFKPLGDIPQPRMNFKLFTVAHKSR